ncbi:hypothetical protein [Desulfolucanica intricata]|nr:hypothetical protein [Desulfolucanica intricata]
MIQKRLKGGSEVSEGMTAGIDAAEKPGLRIKRFNSHLEAVAP